MFENKKISLYVTGGIAVYKAIDLMRTLIKRGAEVRVAMTEAATEFVSPLLFQTLSGHSVYVDTFTEEDPRHVAHVHLADWSDAAIVAPATANTIAKAAHGIADDFVTSSLLAQDAPVFWVPAMNTKMYHHPATRANRETLEEYGMYVMTPDTGLLAEGYEGTGRFPETSRIIEELEIYLRPKWQDQPLAGEKILVTAGGTAEPLDPVRYLTNRSSGKMGHALAEAAANLGASVTLVTASSLPTRSDIERVDVESAEEMYQQVSERFSSVDALIMSAAVSDYRPKNLSDQKMKKQDEWTLELVKNPDILQEMGRRKEDQVLIGFAAETEHLQDYALRKLKEKNLDMIVANRVGEADRGFNADQNGGIIMTRDERLITIPLMTKTQMAAEIMKEYEIFKETHN